MARGISVDELLDTATSAEIGEAAAYYAEEPPVTEALDYLFANVCCVLVSLLSSGKGRKPRLEDFLLFNRPPSRDPTPEDIARWRKMCYNATKMFGGKIIGPQSDNRSA